MRLLSKKDVDCVVMVVPKLVLKLVLFGLFVSLTREQSGIGN